jgi:hypothetical protein
MAIPEERMLHSSEATAHKRKRAFGIGAAAGEP